MPATSPIDGLTPTSMVEASTVSSLQPLIPGVLEFDELGLMVALATLLVVLVLLLSAPSTRLVVQYSALTALFLLSALATISAVNVLVFYISWELTALFAWGISRLTDDDAEQPTSIIPFNAAGAVASFCMFMALLLAVSASRTLAFDGLRLGTVRFVDVLLLSAVFLKSYGILSEGWQATPRLTASLSSATLAGAAVPVVGLYPFLRFFADLQRAETAWREVAIPVASAVAVLAALAALGHLDLRRVVSYAALSQLAALVLVFSAKSELVLRGVTIGVFTYTLGITGIALGLGLAEAATRRHNIKLVGGLAQRMPLTAVLFLLCACSFVGLPPLGGFVSAGTISLGLRAYSTEALVVWLAVSALLLLALGRLFVHVFLGPLRVPVAKESPSSIQAALIFLVTILTFIGLQPAETLGWLAPTATRLIG